jgi:hypothetical protein
LQRVELAAPERREGDFFEPGTGVVHGGNLTEAGGGVTSPARKWA